MVYHPVPGAGPRCGLLQFEDDRRVHVHKYGFTLCPKTVTLGQRPREPGAGRRRLWHAHNGSSHRRHNLWWYAV